MERLHGVHDGCPPRWNSDGAPHRLGRIVSTYCNRLQENCDLTSVCPSILRGKSRSKAVFCANDGRVYAAVQQLQTIAICDDPRTDIRWGTQCRTSIPA